MNSNISKYQQSIERREERKKKRLRYDRIVYTVIAFLFIALIVLTTKALATSTDEVKETAPAPKSEVVVQKEQKEVEKKVEVKEVKVPAQPKKVEAKKVETGFVYNEDIPMPKDHQAYLYELTEKHGLDYVKTLAVIQHESVFDANAINPTNDYGYFQINIVNHEPLSGLLGTPNTPFDPYVNMEWGTYMLADLYEYWSEQGYKGQGLDDAVWSSYNKGKVGFLKYGHAEEYIHKMKASIEKIQSVM